MKKIILILVIGFLLVGCSSASHETKNYTAEDLKEFMGKIYQDIIQVVPIHDTVIVDDEDDLHIILQYEVGELKFREDIRHMVTSTAMLVTVPYQLSLIKINHRADIEKIKNEIADYLCFQMWGGISIADRVSVTNYGSVLIVLKSENLLGDIILQEIKKVTNDKIGKIEERFND